jgi:hypothetical protein
MTTPARPEDRILAENFKTGLQAALALSGLAIRTSNEEFDASARPLPMLGISAKRTGDSLIIRDPSRGPASEFEISFEIRAAFASPSSPLSAETIAGTVKTAVNTISSAYFSDDWTVVDAFVWGAVEREFEEAVRIIRLNATCIGIFKI